MSDDLQVALRAAQAGAAEGMRWFADLARLRREQKPDGTVVTEADRSVERAVRAVLEADRPGDAVLGEEGGQTGEAPRRWIIDPIDGTALFVTGDDRWLVLIALESDGEIVAGVAAVPAQDRIWWAARGEGAWESTMSLSSPRRVSVVSPGLEGRSGVVPPPPLSPGLEPSPQLSPLRPGVVPSPQLSPLRLGVVPLPPRAEAASILEVVPGLPWRVHPPLLVARGDLDLAVQTSGHIWDFAATSLIISEAGGVYSTLDGGARPGRGVSVFASSAELRDRALAILRD